MQKITSITFVFGLIILTVFAGCSDSGRSTTAVVTNNNAANNNAANMTMNNTAANTMMNNTVANAERVRVADITGNMNNYANKTVTVNGWVERSYSANSFRLDEDSIFKGGVDNDLLVVGKSGVIPAGMKFGTADARVSVTGTVRAFVVADIERDLGIDLTNEIEAEFKDKPVLVASSVRVLEREE